MIKVDNLTLHHVRIDDNAARASICKESFFELQDVAMLVIKAPNKSLQRDFKSSSAIEPGAMDTVTGAINVTIPHALEAHQDIAGNKRSPVVCQEASRKSYNFTCSMFARIVVTQCRVKP